MKEEHPTVTQINVTNTNPQEGESTKEMDVDLFQISTIIGIGARDGNSASTSFKSWQRYEVMELLGAGGMGMVYKARDPQLNRYVALKFIRRDSPELMERFAREAQAQARIDHEYVCKVYEVGEVESTPYIAMQYIDGQSLDKVHKQISLEEKIKLILDVTQALNAAHKLGIIHRDIKPGNIMVERKDDGQWRPYIMDFGLAREVEGESQTMTGVVLGTPAYMSAEQANGYQIDRRSDIYSLGAMLYELLAGRPPFTGNTHIEVVIKVIAGDALPIRKISPEVPADLETIVMKCLEKEPARRYESAKLLADDLSRYLEGEPIRARPASWTYLATKKAKKHKWILAVSALSLMLAILLGGMWLRARWAVAEQARQEQEKVRLAQQLGREVKEIEAILRYGYLLPLHNTARERAMVGERIIGIEGQMKQLGKIAEGPGNYALGRGYLALHDYPKAYDYLQKAWQVGYRDAEVGYALGQVLGELYKKALDELPQVGNKELQELRRKEIEKQYREPALQYLKTNAGASVETGIYVEGLIAFYEKRYAEALQKAEQAFEQMPWLYEAKQLAGATYVMMGKEKFLKGNYQAAIDDYTQAVIPYQAAISIARSDASVYEGEATRGSEILIALQEQGQWSAETFQQAITMIDKALVANPESSTGYTAKSWLHVQQGLYQMNHGESPVAFETAIMLAGQAIEKNPQELNAYNCQGLAYYRRGQYDIEHGVDGRPAMRQAIEIYQQVKRIAPNFVSSYINMGGGYWRMGMYEKGLGIDPTNALDNAIENFQTALKLDANNAYIYNLLGNAYEIKGEYEAQCGRDPRAFLAKSIASYDKSISINPNFAFPHANIGIANRSKGRYEIMVGINPHASFDAAIASVEKGIKINPFADAYKYMGEAYLGKAEFDVSQKLDATATLQRAINAFETAQKIKPTDFQNYLRLGQVELIRVKAMIADNQISKPDFEKTYTYLSRALQLNSQDAEVYQSLADYYYLYANWRLASRVVLQTDLKQGLAMVDKALSINAQSALALARQGSFYLLATKVETNPQRQSELRQQATNSIERALKINPLLKREYEPLLH